MADMDPLGLFPASMMAQAIRLGQSRFYSTESAIVATTTWNASDKNALVTLTNNNLTADALSSSGSYVAVRAGASKLAGKYYFEGRYPSDIVTANQLVGIGSATASLSQYLGQSAQSGGLDGAGNIQGIGAGTDGDPNLGDIISVAVDCDNKRIWFRVNGGIWNGSAGNNPTTNVGGKSFAGFTGPVFPMWNGGFSHGVFIVNFGATAFAYAVPSGFTSGWPA